MATARGALAVEVGEGQAVAVGELMREAGFVTVEVRRDLAGIERVVVGEMMTEVGSRPWAAARRHGRRWSGRSPPAASRSSPPTASTGSPATRSTPAAIERIHQLKGRDDGKPSAVMYFSPLAMRELVGGLGPRAKAAVSALLPGPVTLVVANPERRYPLACREDAARLGVRLLGGPLAGAMCPIFQTSANRSGEPAPVPLRRRPGGDRRGADLAIDGGELTGLPSTVVDVAAIDAGGSWTILREGAVSEGDLASALAAFGVG